MKKLFALTLLVAGMLLAGNGEAADISALPYLQEDFNDTSIHKNTSKMRKRAQVGIYLANGGKAFTPDELGATCAAAAKYYADKNALQSVSIFISDMPGPQRWEGTRLAECRYSPDNGGYSGSDGWTWRDFKVADAPLTDQQRTMKKLWGEMRGKYQKNGSTDDEALSEVIAKKMKIKADDVTLPYIFMTDVDAQKYIDTPAQAPEKPKGSLESNDKLQSSVINMLDSIIEPWRPNHSKGANNLNKLYGEPEKYFSKEHNTIGLTFPGGPFRTRDEIAKNLVAMIKGLTKIYRANDMDAGKIKAAILSKGKEFEGMATYEFSHPKYINFIIYPEGKKKYLGRAEFGRTPIRLLWN